MYKIIDVFHKIYGFTHNDCEYELKYGVLPNN